MVILRPRSRKHSLTHQHWVGSRSSLYRRRPRVEVLSCLVPRNLEHRCWLASAFWSPGNVRSSDRLVVDCLCDAGLVRHCAKVRHQLSSVHVPRARLVLQLAAQLLKVVELRDRGWSTVVGGCALVAEGLHHVQVLSCADGTATVAVS